jgi:hypothetical protein
MDDLIKLYIPYRIGGVIVSVLASSAVDRAWVRARSGQTKDYDEIGICCFKVSDCCLTPIQQFFSYIMARTSKSSMK